MVFNYMHYKQVIAFHKEFNFSAISLLEMMENVNIDGLVQDCSICIANALEIQQACTTGKSLISRVSSQKGPTCHAYAWQVGPFWQDTLDISWRFLQYILSAYLLCSYSTDDGAHFARLLGLHKHWLVTMVPAGHITNLVSMKHASFNSSDWLP